MYAPDISLTPSEQKLFGDVDFDWSRRTTNTRPFRKTAQR
jgi:hypothetical protein